MRHFFDKNIFKKDGHRIDRGDFVLTIGRFDPLKGLDKVVTACKELNLPVVVVGSKWDESYKKKLSQGFSEMVGSGDGENTLEKIVIDYPNLFPEETVIAAKEKLQSK